MLLSLLISFRYLSTTQHDIVCSVFSYVAGTVDIGVLFNLPITILCSELGELPCVMLFDNLNLTDNFASAIQSLRGLAGVYAIKCTITGAI